MKWLKILLILGCLSLVSCLEAEVHSPEDMLSETCKAGVYGETIIRCVNSSGSLQSQKMTNIKVESRALYVFVEPGDYNSNLALADETMRAVANNVPRIFRPLLRQVMINLVVAQFKTLMNTQGKKYDVIYFARSNEYWTPDGFVKSIENVVRNHSTVDLFLFVHGGRSSIYLNPDLQSRVTDVDFNSIQYNLTYAARNRVRSIFMTACYAGAVSSDSKYSIASKLVTVFPKAMAYGAQGVNYGPIHRDMMAFEMYYKNWMFTNAVELGNRVLSKNIKNGQERTLLHMPVFSIKGQARYLGARKSRREIVRIEPLRLNPYIIHNAKAGFFYNQKWDSNITTLNTEKASDAPAPILFGSQTGFIGKR